MDAQRCFSDTCFKVFGSSSATAAAKVTVKLFENFQVKARHDSASWAGRSAGSAKKKRKGARGAKKGPAAKKVKGFEALGAGASASRPVRVSLTGLSAEPLVEGGQPFAQFAYRAGAVAAGAATATVSEEEGEEDAETIDMEMGALSQEGRGEVLGDGDDDGDDDGASPSTSAPAPAFAPAAKQQLSVVAPAAKTTSRFFSAPPAVLLPASGGAPAAEAAAEAAAEGSVEAAAEAVAEGSVEAAAEGSVEAEAEGAGPALPPSLGAPSPAALAAALPSALPAASATPAVRTAVRAVADGSDAPSLPATFAFPNGKGLVVVARGDLTRWGGPVLLSTAVPPQAWAGAAEKEKGESCAIVNAANERMLGGSAVMGLFDDF